jgi:hypothetical protein
MPIRRPRGLLAALSLSFLIAAAPTAAEEWLPEGPAAFGMGGAGVASSDDTSLGYWNPAALATAEHFNLTAFEFTLVLDLKGEILEDADEIGRLIDAAGGDFSVLVNRLDTGTGSQADIQDALRIIAEFPDLGEDGVGIIVNQSAHIRAAPIKIDGPLPIAIGISVGERLIGDIIANFSRTALTTALAKNINTTAGWTNVYTGVPGGAVDHSTGTGTGDFAAGSVEESFAAQLAATIVTTDPTVTAADADRFADEMVFQAQLAGVDINNPASRDVLTLVAEATTLTDPAKLLIDENKSGVTTRGLFMAEVNISGGVSLLGGMVAVGANLRLIEGMTYFNFLPFDKFTEGQQVIEDSLLDFEHNTKRSTNVGLDLSVMVEPIEGFRAGAIARNLNKPKFDMVDDQFGNPQEYQLDPQLRLGASVKLGVLTLAADVDALPTDSASIRNLEHQFAGVGLAWDVVPSFLTLRGGMSQDFGAESDPMYTLGASIRLGPFGSINIAAGAAIDRQNVESAKAGNVDPFSVPNAAGASISISLGAAF